MIQSTASSLAVHPASSSPLIQFDDQDVRIAALQTALSVDPDFSDWLRASGSITDADISWANDQEARELLRRHLLAANLKAKERIVGPFVRGLVQLQTEREAAKQATAAATFTLPVTLRARDQFSSSFTIASPRTGRVLRFDTYDRSSLPPRIIERILKAAAEGRHEAAFTRGELVAIVALVDRREAMSKAARMPPTIHGVKRRWRKSR